MGTEREEEHQPESHKQIFGNYQPFRGDMLTYFSAGHMISAPYLAVTDGVSQSKVFNLQDKDAVVELDEVTSFLLSCLAKIWLPRSPTLSVCSCWNARTKDGLFPNHHHCFRSKHT